MRKIVAAVLLMSLCAACGVQTPREPEAPYSAPEDVASIIEPLENNTESASEPESAYEDEPKEPDDPPEDVPDQEPGPVSESAKTETRKEKPTQYENEVKEQPEEAESKGLDGSVIERELLRMINAERESVGVEALGEEESMRFAARIRAEEALESFSHTRPDGTPYNTAFDEAGFSYAGKWHGENIASLKFTDGMYDEKAAALEMFTGLKNSKGHYQNMVGENFYQAGIGVSVRYSDGMTNIASAQLFSSF